jgi:transposase-like protein
MGNLSDATRRAIVNDILRSSTDDKVPHGTYAELAQEYGCHWHTIDRVWKRYTENVAQGIVGGAPESKIKGNSGRKPYDRADLARKISAIPVTERRRVAPTAARIGVSGSLVRSLLTEGQLVRRSGHIKPLLTDKQKVKRVRHALSFIDESTCQFEGMYDVVHIDEKWFNEDVDGRTYLLLPDEEAPQRHRRSKRFIPKTMFLAAVSRPRL